MSLGQKIRELRTAKGLTQSDLGSGLVTPSMISQIESDKANPSYKVLEEIAKKLETPLEYFLTDISNQLEQATLHKVAKALIASESNYERAKNLLLKLLDNPSPTLNLLTVKSDLGDCYLHLQRYDDAVPLFREVIDMAERKGQPPAMLEALNKLGIIEEQRGKPHIAIYYWRTAYERFDQLSFSDPVIESKILMNLGMIHYRLGDFKESLTYYSAAHAHLASSHHHDLVAHTYLGLGQTYLKIRDFEKATEYVQYAIAIFETLKTTKTAIGIKRIYGILKGEEGEVEVAISTLESCMMDYQQNNAPEDATAIYGDIASLYLRDKQYDKCIELCERAISALPNDSLALGPILYTKGIALDNQSNLNEAIRSLEGAATQFASYRMLTELADTYSKLGDLYQRFGDLPKSNECFQNMKQVLDEACRQRGMPL